MTATPYRSDQKDIKHLFGPPVVEISLEEGIAMGWLADLEYQILSDELDEEKLDKIISGEIRIYRGRKPGMRSLNNTLFIRKRDEEIAKHIKLHSSQGRKTLIFCQSIAQADWFCPFLGPAAQVFHSSRNKAKNEIALREFKEGPIKYLLVVDKLNEAFDMPEVEVVIFLRSTDSKRIFFQQLGRGLRKTRTKRKVLVLDFVANCERLMYLATLASNIKRFSEEKLFQENSVPGTEFNVFVKTPKKPKSVSSVEEKAIFAIDGKNFNFAFTHKIVKAMGVLKMIREGYYPTWQQAAEAAKNLGFSSAEEYRTGYYKDPRLPSSPPSAYSDFPSWLEFFGKEKREFYLTWQEASKAAIALGIKSGRDYGDRKKYKADSKLPALPEVYYSDFPGYLKFLGKELYKSWQECSVAVIALGVKSSDDYGLNLKRYREADPGLPNRPSRYYKDFPGWSIFLNRDDFYPTWQKASASAISLGIKRPREYRGKCDTDSRLPKQPQHFYDSFPGWEKFLKFKKIKKYSTWQEASKSVVRLGIGDWEEYRVNYKKDPRLPAGPTGFYSNYPGPEKFFGKK